MQRALVAHPEMALQVVQDMADRLIELTQMVAARSLHTVEARLARQLLEQADADRVHRQRWSTQAEMASLLGTVPDVLSRVLRSLVEENLIQVERHQIRILDRE
jgi:CRP-like cAMP-binding protein